MKISFRYGMMAGVLAVILLVVLIGCFAYLSTKNVQKISRTILKENVSSLKAAEELELAVLNQKGLVASYFLDGNSAWLETLEERKRDFEEWYDNAWNVALTPGEKEILKDIRGLYTDYDRQRDRAVFLLQQGHLAAARRVLLNEMRNGIELLYQKCEDLILANELLVTKAEASSLKQAGLMMTLIWSTILATLCLGGVLGFWGAKKINEQFVRSKKLAALGQLSALVAHEIRNPLTSIKMRLFTIEEQVRQNPSVMEDARVIAEEIARMEKTVMDFLDFARLPSPRRKPSDIHVLLEATVGLLSSRMDAMGVRVCKKFSAGVSKLNVDPEQMRQVFLNIFLNALEAMPQGGVLDITTENVGNSSESGVLITRIKDSGGGIRKDIKGKVFDPFFTTKPDGTGLGLYISRQIVRMHKGDLGFESIPASGAMFILKLPVNYSGSPQEKKREREYEYSADR